LDDDAQLPVGDAAVSADSLPFITAEFPGCGGQLKAVPEDFEVEEVPAYLPAGEGEHLFLWVEKVGRSSQEVALSLSSALSLSERDISYAGQKDRHAVTRQLFCVPAKAEDRLGLFAESGVKILWAKRHRNKLKTGHLKGNRFRIRLRDVRDVSAARATLGALAARGFPNFFGAQRFGRHGDNAEKGLTLLRGERLPGTVGRYERRMFLSAAQSLLFNRALAARLREGTFATALKGDVMKKLETGGVFTCTDPAADQPRVERFEVSPAGPIFGPKMEEAEGEVAQAEEKLLAHAMLVPADLLRGRGETEGTRRPYRLPLREVAIEPLGADLVLSFDLPRGSYATVLLRELLKLGR
jgi:tRNA pseudouridine13 synthase